MIADESNPHKPATASTTDRLPGRAAPDVTDVSCCGGFVGISRAAMLPLRSYPTIVAAFMVLAAGGDGNMEKIGLQEPRFKPHRCEMAVVKQQKDVDAVPHTYMRIKPGHQLRQRIIKSSQHIDINDTTAFAEFDNVKLEELHHSQADPHANTPKNSQTVHHSMAAHHRLKHLDCNTSVSKTGCCYTLGIG